ncbi:hypothetical protein CLV83_1479 [Marinobacterium mangrovicola]|uniref:Uncharacterized protein n=1 Tax=Marinobacterium mangrovicola TaxID=1476959 RepID=A0A4R1GPU4_9GAMM|nr:hypothetical protein CLV83_1479 [Marinobacterium mangrovicola]
MISSAACQACFVRCTKIIFIVFLIDMTSFYLANVIIMLRRKIKFPVCGRRDLAAQG